MNEISWVYVSLGIKIHYSDVILKILFSICVASFSEISKELQNTLWLKQWTVKSLGCRNEKLVPPLLLVAFTEIKVIFINSNLARAERLYIILYLLYFQIHCVEIWSRSCKRHRFVIASNFFHFLFLKKSWFISFQIVILKCKLVANSIHGFFIGILPEIKKFHMLLVIGKRFLHTYQRLLWRNPLKNWVKNVWFSYRKKLHGYEKLSLERIWSTIK